MKILVAEDVPDNRFLIEVYMQGSPHVLTFVEDGRAAVDQFRNATFDLILMDVRMPGMDGLEATRAIRAIERDRGSESVPIIALTAHALPEDLAEIMKAGCSAHVSKPVTLADLRNAVDAFSTDASPEAPGGPEEPAGNAIELETPAGLEGICHEYLCSRRGDYRTLMKLIAALEFEEIRTLAHNMKGTGRSYGFDKLTELGSAMEVSATGRDLAALTAQIAELRQYLRRVRLKCVIRLP
ncbi:MAG TPA: response regulator [Bryobacteraceae bacterium]|nr:response regulator [Bryobacteraceae bacterium]